LNERLDKNGIFSTVQSGWSCVNYDFKSSLIEKRGPPALQNMILAAQQDSNRRIVKGF